MRRFFYFSLAVARVFRAEIPDESQFVQIKINTANDPAVVISNGLENERTIEPAPLVRSDLETLEGVAPSAYIYNKFMLILNDCEACTACKRDLAKKYNYKAQDAGHIAVVALTTGTHAPITTRNAIPATCHNTTDSCVKAAHLDAAAAAVPLLTGTSRTVPNNLNLDWADGVRDGNFTYTDNVSMNTRIYNLDTGINCWHYEFSGRCRKGWDAYFATRYGPNQLGSQCRSSSYRCAHDKNGHGTHTAGTNAADFRGAANQAEMVAVKVLDDRGNAAVSQIVAGMYWAVEDCRNFPPVNPMGCVISMSVGVQGRITAFRVAIDDALTAGVTTVVAAGNGNGNACNYSPGYVASAVTVGSAEDIGNANRVRRSSFSNYGICVDIWAIGTEVNSISFESKTTTTILSGTSMAAPLVAGAIAIFMGQGFNSTVFSPVERMNALARPGLVQQLPINFNNKFLRIASENFQP